VADLLAEIARESGADVGEIAELDRRSAKVKAGEATAAYNESYVGLATGALRRFKAWQDR
jgi:hypothetical protein